MRAILVVALPIAHDLWRKSWAGKIHLEADKYEGTHNPECDCEAIDTMRHIADQLEEAEHPWWLRYATYLRPMKDDEVEAWLLRHREADHDPQWRVMLDDLIDDYRMHAECHLTLDQDLPKK